MKSIKAKILALSLGMLVALCGIISVTNMYINYKGTLNTLELSCAETVKTAALYMETVLDKHKSIALETGYVKEMSDPKVSTKEKQELMEAKSKTFGYVGCDLANKKGISYFDSKSGQPAVYL